MFLVLFSQCTKSLLFRPLPSSFSAFSVVVAAAFCKRAKGFCESETRKSILHAQRSPDDDAPTADDDDDDDDHGEW